jgi:hypothetical protein
MKFVSLFFIIFCFNVHALVNGRAIKNSFPLVQIQFKNISHLCTGTYINTTTILTAAHCISDKKTWPGFSLEIESVLDSDLKKINVNIVKLIPHPKFEYHLLGNKHDVGIIKTTPCNFSGPYPRLYEQGKLGGQGTLFGCGKISFDSKTRDCLTGENEYSKMLGHLVSWGFTSNHNNDGTAVSIAANDSGGPILDKKLGVIIGVHWGYWGKLLKGLFSKAPFYMTDLTIEENKIFINKYL